MAKKKTDQADPPASQDGDVFKNLVKDCIEAYRKLANDSLALDYCKVLDRKLRAMVINDNEYKAETRNIYARQRLEEIEEIEYLASLAANSGMEAGGADDGDEDYYEKRDGKREPKKASTLDKEFLNMRFKAAQMKRELRSELASAEGDVERDSTIFHVLLETREEIAALINMELNEGTDDADMDELTGQKEAMPEGTSGKVRDKGRTNLPDDEPFEMVGENGEIIEL